MKEMKARRPVHVYRNPKDVAVSAYFMVKSSFRAVAPYTQRRSLSFYKREWNPGSYALAADALTTRPTRW